MYPLRLFMEGLIGQIGPPYISVDHVLQQMPNCFHGGSIWIVEANEIPVHCALRIQYCLIATHLPLKVLGRGITIQSRVFLVILLIDDQR
jgi:hypothetical protein